MIARTLARTVPRLDHPIVAVEVVISAAAIALASVWITAWNGPSYGDRWLLPVLLLLGAAATHFPVELTLKFKTNTATAVYFAILLLYPPPVAMLSVGLAVLAANATLALRRNSHGQRMRGVYDTVFNTSQTTLAIGIAATALYALRPETPTALLTTADLWAIPAAAACFYLTTTGLVSVVVGIQLA